jgi:outer membrane protein assembly factor BamE (lipoprotein component of BamABCDE complex)
MKHPRQSTPSRTVFALGAVFALLLVFVVGCVPNTAESRTALATVQRGPTEAIGADILGQGLVSTESTVLGVKLGMTQSQVRELLGEPDHEQTYDFGAISNWEYAESLLLDDTGVLFHFRNGFVTRITLFDSLNEHLEGSTQIGMSRSDVYNTFGVPDRQYDTLGGRYFVYNERGLEVYLSKDKVRGYALVLPNRKLPSTATLPGMVRDPFKPVTPRLLVDTTTLCDEGPTQAFNPGTGECTLYENACAIPESAIEVDSCEASSLTDEALMAALVRSQQG